MKSKYYLYFSAISKDKEKGKKGEVDFQFRHQIGTTGTTGDPRPCLYHYFHFFNRLPKIPLINGIVSIKHRPGGMSGDPHNNGFRDTRLSHVGVERMPEIMEHKSAFLFPAINNPCRFTCLPQSCSQVGNGRPFEQEHMVVMDRLGYVLECGV